MDADRLRRMEELFHGASSLPESAQDEYLRKKCPDDESLREEVKSMIRLATRTSINGSSQDPAKHSEPMPEGSMWGDFKLLRRIGHGSFGQVYLAWDPSLAREIALKVVQPRDPASALREGQMLARVRHVNVVTVFSAKQLDGEVGLAMELIRGRHLGDVVLQSGPMGAEEATSIGMHVCQALAAVHSASLLHRDIKAHNVMRESGGRIVLMDFGASRDTAPDAPARGDLAGTLLYMAPELLQRQSASRASDIYSVGVLLFYLVTGEYPVEGSTIEDVSDAHVAGIRKRLADRRPDLPAPFVRVVERALSPRAADRQPSAGELFRELSELSVASSGWTSARWWWRTIMIAALAGTLGLFGVGFLTTATYDQALSRGGFEQHSIADWWLSGYRATLPMALLSVTILILGWMVVTAGRLLRRKRTGREGPTWRLWLAPGGDMNTVARALVLVQFVAIVAFIWVFFDLLWAMVVQADKGPRAVWSVLDPDGNKVHWYLFLGSSLFACAALAWTVIIRARRQGFTLDVSPMMVGVAMVVLLFLLTTVPWRLFYGSTLPRVDIGGERCYETGLRDETLLAFCPDIEPPPRNKTRPTSDPSIRRLPPERIFTSKAKAAVPPKDQPPGQGNGSAK